MTLSQHVGQRIRELREARGRDTGAEVDTFEVALTINEMQSELELYENGDALFIFYDMLEKLAKYFNVEPKHFFEGFEQ